MGSKSLRPLTRLPMRAGPVMSSWGCEKSSEYGELKGILERQLKEPCHGRVWALSSWAMKAWLAARGRFEGVSWEQRFGCLVGPQKCVGPVRSCLRWLGSTCIPCSTVDLWPHASMRFIMWSTWRCAQEGFPLRYWMTWWWWPGFFRSIGWIRSWSSRQWLMQQTHRKTEVAHVALRAFLHEGAQSATLPAVTSMIVKGAWQIQSCWLKPLEALGVCESQWSCWGWFRRGSFSLTLIHYASSWPRSTVHLWSLLTTLQRLQNRWCSTGDACLHGPLKFFLAEDGPASTTPCSTNDGKGHMPHLHACWITWPSWQSGSTNAACRLSCQIGMSWNFMRTWSWMSRTWCSSQKLLGVSLSLLKQQMRTAAADPGCSG